MAAAARAAASTPAWMSEMMGLEEETGLTCMVCHEGYKCKVTGLSLGEGKQTYNFDFRWTFCDESSRGRGFIS